MSEFNVGDKFVIEIGEKFYQQWQKGADMSKPSILYRIKGFNSLVFDDNGLQKLKRIEDVLFEVGDEVKSTSNVNPFLVTSVCQDDNRTRIFGVENSGICRAEWLDDGVYKTGRHFGSVDAYLLRVRHS